MDTDERTSQHPDAILASGGTPSSVASRSTPETRQRKSRKVTRACDACKSKKKACTGNIPCVPCIRRKVDCTYDTSYHRGVAVTPPSSNSRPSHDSPTLRKTTQDAESESTTTTPYAPPDRRLSTDVIDQYWGPTSAHSFLDQAVRDLPATQSNVVSGSRDSDRASEASIFHFGDRIAPEVQLGNFSWPERAEAEGLVRRYFEFACPTYRTLHQPTIERAINELYGEETQYVDRDLLIGESSAYYAVLLMVFSTATMYRPDANGRMTDADDAGWKASELYFVRAEQLLSQEIGAPRLESVQARFLMVLYLLSTSRANKAWFTLGTAIQLMMALGFHNKRARRDNDGEDFIQRESRRRIIWSSYTLDKYISVILGRPRLWHDGDMDEELPARVNDIDLLPTRIQSPQRDCVMDAPVLHALLARTLSQAAKEPYVVAGISNRDQLNTIRALCANVDEWHVGLPPILSGDIHPSSLVPVFQRQLTVLQLARYHLLMFITRPLLLRNYGQIWPDCEASYVQYLGICLTSARDAIEMVLTFVRENQLFHAFWYSQYITFNALSIIYIYLIQVRRGRIKPISNSFCHSSGDMNLPSLDEQTLYNLSETAQYHLADATVRNSPSWKYSAILQGLRRELERLGLRSPFVEGTSVHPGPSHSRNLPSALDSESDTRPMSANPSRRHLKNAERMTTDYPPVEPVESFVPFSGMSRGDAYFADPRTECLFDSFAADKDLMLDFWPQLDSLPVSKFSFFDV